MTLVLKLAGIRPRKQDPSNTIVTSRTRVLERAERPGVLKTKLKTLNDRLTKPAQLFSWTPG